MKGQPTPVLTVEGLTVETLVGAPIVDDLSLQLAPGEVLGVVGESGSGKTTTALALLGYAQAGVRIERGTVTIAGERIVADGDVRAARKLRGRAVSYVPQNPGTALNPSLRIGPAIGDMLRAHRDDADVDSVVPRALTSVGLAGDDAFRGRYPHQISGGQQQRVCIAVALVCEPPVVVLDEPTTGLDVVTQARILDELLRLRADRQISMVYVTHDLAVIGEVADRIAVMYAGRIVEHGPAGELLRRPRHPYTRGLLSSIPDHLVPRVLEPMTGVAVGVGDWPAGCAFAPRCSLRVDECDESQPALRPLDDLRAARCIRPDDVPSPSGAAVDWKAREPAINKPVLRVEHLRAEYRRGRETVVAADDVSFAVRSGECIALVGESGSGKTTIARAIAGLHPIANGEILLAEKRLAGLSRRRTREQRRRVQIVFQNPAEALNPRHRVCSIIATPARMLLRLTSIEANAEVDRLLDLVRLPAGIAERYPGELSGGEQQRVAIARALAVQPDIMICDEVTSSLDVSVQAAVLDLLGGLRDELGLAMLFITHDLGVVATIADEVLVLDRGHVCEAGPVRSLLEHPRHDYTRQLLEAAPSISQALGDEPQPTHRLAT